MGIKDLSAHLEFSKYFHNFSPLLSYVINQ